MKTTRSKILSIAISLIVVSFAALECGADALDHWHWRNPLPSGNTLNGVAFGNGTFVTVGNVGALLTSTNGTNWTVSDPLGPTLRRVIFASGKFVAVGDSGTVVTST